MHRRQLIKGFAALVIAERLGILQAAWASGDKLPPPGIFRIKGEVKVNGQIARVGSPVKPGDVITTGAQSEAIYIIGQDAYLQRDNSTVSIAGDALKAGLRVLTGKLMAVFGKGEKRIEAGTATIGIRGTGCYIEAEETKVYFCLCYGKADITSSRMPGKIETIETKHHENPVTLHADGRQMMEKAPMLNHTDAELTLLESLVGRVPAFHGQPGYSYK
ncbi:MAG: hypothetical protein RLZZ298_2874 [Pseudomonadota bacterium]|jgi:hypothetical protein